MSTNTVHAAWVRDQVFILNDRNEFPIVMTQPNGANGADLLPLSLIGCSAWDIMSNLKSEGLSVSSFEATAASEQDESPPWRFTRIHIHYRIAGESLTVDQVLKAIELSEARFCSVYATLRDAVAITRDFEIVGAGDEVKQYSE